MPFRPTPEQEFAVERFTRSGTMKITAFAGTGKTATLVQIASSTPRRGLYLAFNRKMKHEATTRFASTNVECLTTHALARRAVVAAYPKFTNECLTTQLFPRSLANILSLKRLTLDSGIVLTALQQSHLILGTIKAFCHSDDDTLLLGHVPLLGRLPLVSGQFKQQIKEWALRHAAQVWDRMKDPNDPMPLGHDGYLKLWSLGKPILSAEYILLDEAQDTNPAVLSVLQVQQSQLVYVGDSHQQIYEWRGAVDAMSHIKAAEEACLTQSFRFGDRLAASATKVLHTLGESRAVRGNPAMSTDILSSGAVDTVLARTNASVILEALNALNEGVAPFIVGGTTELRDMVRDVYRLKKKEPATRPEFVGFANWQEVVDHSKAPEGSHLVTFVNLVEQHGEAKLMYVLSNVADAQEDSGLVISTAHRAKGLEWDRVRLTDDFASRHLAGDAPNPEAEVRLFYVAMTRAKQTLVVAPSVLMEYETASWREKRTSQAVSHVARPERSPTAPESLDVSDHNAAVMDRIRARRNSQNR